jgi:hypothetical protein
MSANRERERVSATHGVVLGCGLILGLGALPSALRAQATQQGGPPPGVWEGPYRPIAPDANSDNPWHSCCEIAHAVLLIKPGQTQGKVLIIQGNGARWIWDPAAPNSISADTFNDIELENLFCSCHSVDGEGNVVVHGGLAPGQESRRRLVPARFRALGATPWCP